MRNLLSLIIILLSSSLLVQAQFVKNLGFKGGICIATQSIVYTGIIVDSNNPQYKIGGYGVVSAEFFNRKCFAFFVDLGYIQKGYQQRFSLTDAQGNYIREVNSRFSYNYISFIPQTKLYFNIKNWMPYCFIGPRLDYFLNEAVKAEGFNPYTTTNTLYNKFTFGITYGAGAEYKRNQFGYLIELQHQPDFTPVVDTKPKPYPYIVIPNFGVKVTNKAFVAAIGFKYYFSKS